VQNFDDVAADFTLVDIELFRHWLFLLQGLFVLGQRVKVGSGEDAGRAWPRES